MKRLIKRVLEGCASSALADVVRRLDRQSDLLERQILLSGVAAAMALRGVERIGTLSDAGFRVFSQWEEDGILEWLIQALPHIPQTFIEFGVETYREANTRFLLRHRNWRGLILDGSSDHLARIAADHIHWQHDLTARCAMVSAENVNQLFADNGFTGEIGILSVDVDGNDYWIWKAIQCVNPQIVVCEYNAVLGDEIPLSIPYDGNFYRTDAHHSNLYWGASIGALTSLARSKGYRLLGSNRAGNNAFFLREDLCPPVTSRIGSTAPFPSLYRESRNAAGALTFATGAARLDVIRQCPATNVESGETRPLGEWGRLYSESWLALMGQR